MKINENKSKTRAETSGLPPAVWQGALKHSIFPYFSLQHAQPGVAS